MQYFLQPWDTQCSAQHCAAPCWNSKDNLFSASLRRSWNIPNEMKFSSFSLRLNSPNPEKSLRLTALCPSFISLNGEKQQSPGTMARKKYRAWWNVLHPYISQWGTAWSLGSFFNSAQLGRVLKKGKWKKSEAFWINQQKMLLLSTCLISYIKKDETSPKSSKPNFSLA